MKITHFPNICVPNTAYLATVVLRFVSRCLIFFFGSTAFVSTPVGIEYFNNNSEEMSRTSFFLNESVPEDLVSDTWRKVVDFYLGGDSVVTTTNVHSIINVSVM